MEERLGSAESQAEHVARLIAGGETFEVESKGKAGSGSTTGTWSRRRECLANGSGGLLLVGVEDDGTVTGARLRHDGRAGQPGDIAATAWFLASDGARHITSQTLHFNGGAHTTR